MDFNITPEMTARLMQRSQNTIGELVVAGFAREDMIEQQHIALNQMAVQLEEARNDARLVREKLEQAYTDQEELRKQLDPSRGTRFTRKKR